MDITELLQLSWGNLMKLLVILAVLGIGPAVRMAIATRVKKWGDRDRQSTSEDVDIDRVVEKVRNRSLLAKTMPNRVVRDAVRRHRSSDPPPLA